MLVCARSRRRYCRLPDRRVLFSDIGTVMCEATARPGNTEHVDAFGVKKAAALVAAHECQRISARACITRKKTMLYAETLISSAVVLLIR